MLGRHENTMVIVDLDLCPSLCLIFIWSLFCKHIRDTYESATLNTRFAASMSLLWKCHILTCEILTFHENAWEMKKQMINSAEVFIWCPLVSQWWVYFLRRLDMTSFLSWSCTSFRSLKNFYYVFFGFKFFKNDHIAPPSGSNKSNNSPKLPPKSLHFG